MSRKVQIERIKEGVNKGKIGAYIGESFIGLVEPRTFKRTVSACDAEGYPPDSEPEPGNNIVNPNPMLDPKHGQKKPIQASADDASGPGGRESSSGPGGRYWTGPELTKFINERYPMLSALPDKLAVAVAEKMLSSGSNDFAACLREATRDPANAQLWDEHRATHTMTLTE